MLIKSWNSAVDDFDRRKKWQTEAIPSSEDDVIYILELASI
jgi:hypothetical protein